MKILLFGSRGQLGQALTKALEDSYQLYLSHRDNCDLTKPSQIENFIDQVKPNLILNAAAYNDVDAAENYYEKAFALNVHAPGIMAKKANELDIPMIHFSSNYVFDGFKKNAYLENDPIHPISNYGKTKYLGEENIRYHLKKHLIIRTSWLYGHSGKNFIYKVFEKLKQNKPFDMVEDCWGSPTPASFIARSILNILPHLRSENFGIYHLTTLGSTNPYDCAAFIEKKLLTLGAIKDISFRRIHPIKFSEYQCSAKRPLHAALDCTKIRNTFMLEFRSWQDELNTFLDESFLKGP